MIKSILGRPKTNSTVPASGVSSEADGQGGKKDQTRHPYELRRQALEIFENGGSYKNCARILDIPLYTVRDWFRCYTIGTFRTERGARQQRYSLEQRKAVLTLRQQGASYNEISKMTKVNRATVLQWIHKDIEEKAHADELLI